MLLSSLLNYKIDSVSGLVPSYNRYLFFPNLIKIWCNQNYDIMNRELVFIDDSDINYVNKIKWDNIPCIINYYYSSKKLTIGQKRNLLNRLSNGIWLSCFDDDDYYFEERINYCISILKKNNKLIGGCSKLYVYSPINNKIYSTNFIGSKHATNATLFYHFKFLLISDYNNLDEKGEEKYFLKNFSIDLIQFDSLKIMIVIAHLLNTINKYNLLNSFNLTDLNPNMILNTNLINFYKNILIKQLN